MNEWSGGSEPTLQTDLTGRGSLGGELDSLSKPGCRQSSSADVDERLPIPIQIVSSEKV